MILPDPTFMPPKCKRCDGTGYEPDLDLYANTNEPDPVACLHCLGNGVLHAVAEYSDSGKLIGYNYPS